MSLDQPRPKETSSPPPLDPSRRFPSAAVAALALLALLSALGFLLTRRSSPETDRARLEAAIRQGNLLEAEAAFRRLESSRALTPRDRLAGARIALQNTEHARALALLEAIPEESPEAAQAHALAGRIEINRFGFRRAEAHLKRALQLDPSLVQPRRELLYIYGYQGRYQDQAHQFRALAHLIPLSYLDLVLWTRGPGIPLENKELADVLQKAIQSDPLDFHSRIALADALRALNRPGDAATILQQVPADHPGAIAARVRLAEDNGDLAELRALLSSAPEDDDSLFLPRANLALRSANLDEAARWFQAALQVNPNDRRALQGLVQAEKQQRRPQNDCSLETRLQALNELETLLGRTSPTEQPPKAQLLQVAHALEAVGRLEEARAWFTYIVQLDPLEQDAQKALFRLRDIPSTSAEPTTPPQIPSRPSSGQTTSADPVRDRPTDRF